MSDEQWGPWVDGTICPKKGTSLQMEIVEERGPRRFLHECVFVGLMGDGLCIVPMMPRLKGAWIVDRWRERKPRGLTMLERIAADPHPVKEDA
tara:strand:+ start:12447 stop:12725 length:279 start_codon:yes stop_codon:yes gene_type:complete